MLLHIIIHIENHLSDEKKINEVIKKVFRATFHLFVYIFDLAGKKAITFHFGILCSRHATVESFEFMGTKICRLWGFFVCL